MSKKVLIGILLALSLLLSSCYPELSVQQYDKLREELAVMDTEHNEMQAELTAIKAELKTIEAKNAETLAYVEFLDKLVSAQSLTIILSGQFDVGNLIDNGNDLVSAAEKLGDSTITYYLELIDPDDESQSAAAYYKAIEYCLKKMKQNLK